MTFDRKRLFGLIGQNGCGKDTVANFLKETRGFKRLAFADRIKTEAGIDPNDFEAAKVSGKIEEVRRQLWEFSDSKIRNNPLYFIQPVMTEALKQQNAVITDIRTSLELDTFFEYGSSECRIKRVYLLTDGDKQVSVDDSTGFLKGSKLKYEIIRKFEDEGKIVRIQNDKSGLFCFMSFLDKFFFREDLVDLFGCVSGGIFDDDVRNLLSKYLDNYSISGKKHETKFTS